MVRVLGFKEWRLMRIWRNHENCKELTTKQEKLESLSI
jgi:hypothetical protein